MPLAEERIRRPLAVAIVAVAIVLGLVLVGVAIRLNGDKLPSGPPLPPPGRAAAKLQVIDGSREASYGKIKLTLPGAPYLCSSSPEQTSLFDQAVPCTINVHSDYSGSQIWQAQAGLGLVSTTMADPDDVQATARTIFTKARTSFYPKDATVSRLKVGPYAAGGDAALLTARINVSVPKLATTYDAVVMVVIKAEDGRQVAFYSLKPNDAGDEALKSLQAAANTLTVSG